MRHALPTKLTNIGWALALGCMLAMAQAHPAEPVEARSLSAEELETLVGPVALYPDDLLALVLPAATHPLQVVQAARFLEDLEDDPDLRADENWDESVVALLNYPDVLNQLNEDLDWTWELGQAVLHQEQALIAAVERFRQDAHEAGNLTSDEHQRVSVEDDTIRIRPADPEVVYVPYYEPARVRTYVNTPAYHYYPRPYPVYYYPYPAGHHFGNRNFWGVTSVFSIGWQTRHVHYHLHQHRGHPYYGRSYAYRHHDYWRPRLSFGYREHPALRYHPGNHWRPHGLRPGTRLKYRQRAEVRAPRRSEQHAETHDRRRNEQQQPPTQTRQWRAGNGPRGHAAEYRRHPGSRTFRADAPRRAAPLGRAAAAPPPRAAAAPRPQAIAAPDRARRAAPPAAARPRATPRPHKGADGSRAQREARGNARQWKQTRGRSIRRDRQPH